MTSFDNLVCMDCEIGDHEDVLMICEGLEEVPAGSFFCNECRTHVPQSWKDTPPPTDILDEYVKQFIVCYGKEFAVSNMKVFMSIIEHYPSTTQCAVTRLIFIICQENWDNLTATNYKFATTVYKKILEFENHARKEVRAMIKEFEPLKERFKNLPILLKYHQF